MTNIVFHKIRSTPFAESNIQMKCYLWWLKASGWHCPQLHVPAGVPCVIHPISQLSLHPHYVFFMYFTHLRSVWRNLNVRFICFFFFCWVWKYYWLLSLYLCNIFVEVTPSCTRALSSQTVKSPGSCPITFIHRCVLCHCDKTRSLSSVKLETITTKA